jgi:hypothetical protein
LLEWRNLVCGVMIIVVPTSLAAQAPDRALLHNDGGTWLNGSPSPDSSAIFPDTLIQTQTDHTAKIDAAGSSITVLPETIVRFDADELVLDHGQLQLNTTRAMRVRVGCITIIPVTQDWTQYDVIDVDGRVKIIAYKHDVKVHYRQTTAQRAKESEFSDFIVREGEQSTREERCGAPAKPGEIVAAKGPLLDNLWVKGVAAVAIGTITCFALCRTDPVSPSQP